MVIQAVEKAAQFLGLDLSVTPSPKNGDDFLVRLKEAPYPNGFALQMSQGYLVWDAVVIPDPESRPFLAKMKEVYYQENLLSLESVIAASREPGIEFRVNGKPIDQLAIEEEWLNFTVKSSVKVAKPTDDEAATLSALIVDVLAITVWFLDGMLAADPGRFESRHEGELHSYMGNRYERSRVNRAVCLRHFGLRCQGCGELAEEKYGELGKDVIHVHHIIPVSEMGGSKLVDPISDLVPLCPSCHNVVHRESPPVSLGRLREVTGFNG